VHGVNKKLFEKCLEHSAESQRQTHAGE